MIMHHSSLLLRSSQLMHVGQLTYCCHDDCVAARIGHERYTGRLTRWCQVPWHRGIYITLINFRRDRCSIINHFARTIMRSNTTFHRRWRHVWECCCDLGCRACRIQNTAKCLGWYTSLIFQYLRNGAYAYSDNENCALEVVEKACVKTTEQETHVIIHGQCISFFKVLRVLQWRARLPDPLILREYCW